MRSNCFHICAFFRVSNDSISREPNQMKLMKKTTRTKHFTETDTEACRAKWKVTKQR